MASIYPQKNKNGTTSYYGTININGKRYRRLLGYNKTTAQDQLKKLEYEIRFPSDLTFKDGNSSLTQGTTYQKAYVKFLVDLELTRISKKQFDVVRRSVRGLKRYLSNKRIRMIAEVLPEHLKNYMMKRSKEKVANKYQSTSDGFFPTVSKGTLNKDIQNLKRFFRFCRDMGWIKDNPAIVLKTFKQKARDERYYFPSEETNKILEQAGKYHDFYYFLLHTGIRATDAYRLTPENIKNRWLSVVMNKSGDRLQIPLKEDIWNLLKPRIQNQFIFPELQSAREKRNCVKTVQRLFPIDFVRKNNINLHTFRHTYAHTMLNKGVPKEVLQTLLGHRSIKTTEIYANWVRKEELEKWV